LEFVLKVGFFLRNRWLDVHPLINHSPGAIVHPTKDHPVFCRVGSSPEAITGGAEHRRRLFFGKQSAHTMIRSTNLLPAGLLAWFFLIALGSFRADASGFALFDGRQAPSVMFDGTNSVSVKQAAELLARDLNALSGKRVRVLLARNSTCGSSVLIGRADAAVISSLLKQNRIDPTPIMGKWETYGRAVVPDPCDPLQKMLVIFGSDTRGTVWGVIDLTREMGVSAWEWWADVKIRRSNRIVVSDALQYSKEPSVKYRGIFLNDEDWGLQPWAAKTYEPKTHDIGPKTYARIFELMWRLKANTIWPAMHDVTTAFNQIPGNAEMASSYAIIHGTSHAEPMLRNNVREWDVKRMGEFNYLTNKDHMLAYWAARVDESKSFENIYTVGLRGIHDSPMEGVSSAEAAARVMEDVFAKQRELLQTHLSRPADTVPQVLIPYKEVLNVYDAGLRVPDDVTLMWPDDNHGYIRRLSNARERARSGGAGVYYHLSYWGAPMSYLWLATTHPLLVWEEMDKARRFGADRMWIANVGDIKPAEYLTTFFLDMAFERASPASPKEVRAHLYGWLRGIFGNAHAEEIGDILWRYYDLAFTRKPEHMGWNEVYPSSPVHPTAFNMLDFGDENARRLEAYRELSARVAALRHMIPHDRYDAYFQLVQYPVQAAADFNERILNTDKAIAYGLQHRLSANLYAARARQAQQRIVSATHTYNIVMSHGKWNHMMDIAPNRLLQFEPPMFPKWSASGDKGCGLQTEGGQYYDAGGPTQTPGLPAFVRGLERSRYIDLFIKSPEAAAWSARPSAAWIKITRASGRLDARSPEVRLQVSVDWAHAPRMGNASVVINCGKSMKDVPVDVHLVSPPGGVSFVEENRIVSIYASHADERSAGWKILEGLGHTGSSLRSDLQMKRLDAKDPATWKQAPAVTYRFATSTADEPATLNIVALPVSAIDSEHGMRLAASVDGGAAVVLDLRSAEFSTTWRQNVLANTAVGRVPGLHLAPGDHNLTVWALDPGAILDRIEITFDGANAAYGSVPETRVRRDIAQAR
jgi:hypothetical protein